MAESPPSRWKLAHLMAIAGVHFCSVGFLMQLPRYIMAIGGTAQDAGWLLAVGIIPALALAAPVGEWNRRHGGRWPAVLGGVIAAASNLAMILVPQFDLSMCALRLLYAVGQTMLFVTLFSQAAAMGEAAAERARMIGWLLLTMQVGNALGGALGEAAYHQGPVFFWGICSGFAVLAALLSACWHYGPAPIAQASTGQLPASGRAGRWPGEVWAMAAVGMAFAGLTQFMPAFIEHLGRTGQAAPPFAAAWFITPALLVVAVVRFGGGKFAKKLLRLEVIAACHLTLLLTIVALPWISSRNHALLLAVAFGLSYGWLYPALSSLAYTRVRPEVSGKVSGWLLAAFDIGYRLSPVGLGALITHAGFTQMFVGMAVAYAAILVLAWSAARRMI